MDFPTFYPGVSDAAGATVVSVTTGATAVGIDFPLLRPASLKVSGRVRMAATQIGPGVGTVTLMPRSANGVMRLPTPGQVRPDGTFEIVNVLPGSYSVTASMPNTTLKEPVQITVDAGDVSGIELVLLSTEAPTFLKGLEQAWSVSGNWGGVAAREKDGVVLATSRVIHFEIDTTGKTLRQMPFPASNLQGSSNTILRSVMLAAGPAVLSFGAWSRLLTAYDDTGKVLWTYPPATGGVSTGINDAAPVDLDGNGVDEIVVGFNGGTGVHVLNDKGELVWKSTAIGNVWHVAGGDVRGNGKPQVVTTSSAGEIHVFSDDGSDRRNIVPGFYANMVRVGKVSGTDMTATIFAGGSPNLDGNIWQVAAFAGDGTLKWSTSTGRPNAHSTTLATGKPWMAVGLQSGHVFVLDATNGAVIASVDGQGSTPELTWVAEKDSANPLLIVSSRTELRAYRVK